MNYINYYICDKCINEKELNRAKLCDDGNYCMKRLDNCNYEADYVINNK